MARHSGNLDRYLHCRNFHHRYYQSCPKGVFRFHRRDTQLLPYFNVVILRGYRRAMHSGSLTTGLVFITALEISTIITKNVITAVILLLYSGFHIYRIRAGTDRPVFMFSDFKGKRAQILVCNSPVSPKAVHRRRCRNESEVF